MSVDDVRARPGLYLNTRRIASTCLIALLVVACAHAPPDATPQASLTCTPERVVEELDSDALTCITHPIDRQRLELARDTDGALLPIEPMARAAGSLRALERALQRAHQSSPRASTALLLSRIASRYGRLDDADLWLSQADALSDAPELILARAHLDAARGHHPHDIARRVAPHPRTPTTPALLRHVASNAPRTSQRAAAHAATLFHLHARTDRASLLERAALLARVPRLRGRAQTLLPRDDHPLTTLLRADIAARSGAPDQALALLEALRQRQPAHPSILQARARLLRDLGREPELKATRLELRDALRDRLEGAPDDPALHTRLTHAHLAAGDTRAAVRSAEQALALRSADPPSLRLLTLALIADGRTVEAQTYQTRLLRAQRERLQARPDRHAHLELTATLRQLDGSPDALKDALTLLENAPPAIASDPRVLLERAHILASRHQPIAALEAYRGAASADPRLLDAWLGVAQHARHTTDILPALRAALTLDPDRDDLRRRLEGHLRDAGLHRAADALWLERLALPGPGATASLELHRILLSRDLPGVADLILSLLEPFASQDPRLHLARAARLRRLQLPRLALAAAHRAATLTGRGAPLLDHIEALLLEERDDDARAALTTLPRHGLRYDLRRLERLASHARVPEVERWARCSRTGGC